MSIPLGSFPTKEITAASIRHVSTFLKKFIIHVLHIMRILFDLNLVKAAFHCHKLEMRDGGK